MNLMGQFVVKKNKKVQNVFWVDIYLASFFAEIAGMSFQTVKKNTAVVMEACPCQKHWFLHCKKDKMIQFEIKEGYVRVGRAWGGFVTQKISGTCDLKIVPLSKVQYYQVEANGDVHVVLSVVDSKERKAWPWYHFYGKTTHAAETWGKECPSAHVDDSD